MARREALIPNETPEIKTLAWYHGGSFESLKFFNSDRVVKLKSDYTVSADNTKSTLSIIKEGSTVSGFGIELETIIRGISNKTVMANILMMVFDKLFPSDLFKTEQDCTVSAECVSQVMSKAFIRNNYKNFKTMFNDFFPAFGITTDDYRCGMHVNLSNSLFGKDKETQYENIRKLGYLINRHYDLFRVAFRRLPVPDGETCWCPKMTYSKDFWRTAEFHRFTTSHDGCCFNVGHVEQGRIEIRLVGGQKNFASFRNTMETVFHIVDFVKKASWDDLEDVAKVFKGCNYYVFDRLATNCRDAGVISYSDLEKIRPTVKAARFI